MGTGWRRAFCTTVPREGESMAAENASPKPIKTRSKLGLFSSVSNPSTPRFGFQGAANDIVSAGNTPRLRTPSSPRSPFSILKSSLRLSKVGHGSCGVCLQSLKKGQRMAIYTADCSHSFHFQCIAQHVKKQGNLICPVCGRLWRDVPLLSVHCRKGPSPEQNDVVEKTVTPPAHVRTKPYNDDEPLISPTAGARFNPIPEADDENDDDVEEFKGFLVNSTPSTPTLMSSTTGYVHRRRTQRSVEVRLQPEAAVVTVSRSHETFTVAIRVKAPPPPLPPVLATDHRAPIDLVTVLDVGGSMNSTKLQMLKRAMRLVISSLGSSDRLCIVAFSGTPARLLPLRRMTHNGQRLARHIVDNLATGDGKSVSAAMKTAAQVLEDRREKNPVATIILLSDGQDNTSQSSGVNQRQPKRHVPSSRFGHIEIPIHHGSGGDAFAKRVGGLLSVVVQDLRLQLGFSAGSAPGEISAVYSCDGRPRLFSADSIRLGDLYAEEERELLVELRVPTSAAGSHHVMLVRCSYRDPPTGEVMYGRERALLVPRPRAARASEPRIERLRNLFLAARAVAETRRLAERGELGCAQQLLESAKALVLQSSSASAEEYVGWLEAELAALRWQRRRMGEQHVAFVDENGEPLTPTSAWRAAEQLAKVAVMKKSLNRDSDLHGFENARF